MQIQSVATAIAIVLAGVSIASAQTGESRRATFPDRK
jgi:hypothetical protein